MDGLGLECRGIGGGLEEPVCVGSGGLVRLVFRCEMSDFARTAAGLEGTGGVVLPPKPSNNADLRAGVLPVELTVTGCGAGRKLPVAFGSLCFLEGSEGVFASRGSSDGVGEVGAVDIEYVLDNADVAELTEPLRAAVGMTLEEVREGGRGGREGGFLITIGAGGCS